MVRVKKLQEFVSLKKLAILVFVVYFFIGMLIFPDYGISADENIERETSIINYVYVMESLLLASERESVQYLLENTPELMTWPDRFYGVFLQMFTVAIEHLNNFEMATRNIYLMRHAFTFINYFIAGIFFFLILQRRFGNSYIPLLGALFFILSPRFFGGSFFNIKDILFYSWCIIASYFMLRWLEDEKKKAFLIPAAFTIAVATNTRILGISILLLSGGFVFMQSIWRKTKLRHSVKQWLLLCAFSFVFYVIITPFVWENPIRNTINTFFHFLRFPGWGDRTHFYLGEMITSDVPWHYIPVWMGITIPILYIAMFIVGIVVIGLTAVRYITKQNIPSPPIPSPSDNAAQQSYELRSPPHLYDLYFAAFIILTYLGYVVLGISMYEGWRHAYSIYLPFLYIAVCGLAWIVSHLRNRQKWLNIAFSCVVAISLLHTSIWTIVNHPYQYVYFNVVGKQFAERNFTLDYWNVSTIDLLRYALDSEEHVFLYYYSPRAIILTNTLLILTEDEKSRVTSTRGDQAEFYIQTSRVAYEERVGPGDGFEIVKAIEVDGMTISSLWRRTLPFTIEHDYDVWNNVMLFESNTETNINYLFDGNYYTSWNTGRPQQAGDYMMFGFREPVNYNYIRLNSGRTDYPRGLGRNDFPRGLSIYTSLDGVEWQLVPTEVVLNEHFVFESEPYTFLRLEIRGFDDTDWWTVFDMFFGYAQWK